MTTELTGIYAPLLAIVGVLPVSRIFRSFGIDHKKPMPRCASLARWARNLRP